MAPPVIANNIQNMLKNSMTPERHLKDLHVTLENSTSQIWLL
jgi:hypothetical protein